MESVFSDSVMASWKWTPPKILISQVSQCRARVCRAKKKLSCKPSHNPCATCIIRDAVRQSFPRRIDSHVFQLTLDRVIEGMFMVLDPLSRLQIDISSGCSWCSIYSVLSCVPYLLLTGPQQEGRRDEQVQLSGLYRNCRRNVRSNVFLCVIYVKCERTE